MTWWCAAQGTPWTWSWQAYPGVWLLVLGVAAAYAVGLRRVGTGAPRSRIAAFALGLLALWGVSDWPVGPLGAGYLASVHMVQYLVLTLVAPPLLLAGLPPALLRRLIAPRWALRAARILSRPLVAFVIFNVVMLGTHLPAVVDGLARSQLGTFAMDMAWLAAGLVFWWQVLGPLPELEPLGYPGRILFLVLNVFIPTVPASFLTFADYPIYSLYELAPRIGGISAVADQQVAGVLMKLGGGFIIFGTASVLFFRWYRAEEQVEGAT